MSLFVRSFLAALLSITSEVRRIETKYWVAMILVAAIGDLLMILAPALF